VNENVSESVNVNESLEIKAMRLIPIVFVLQGAAVAAQERPLAPVVARFVAVNAPVIALTNVRVVDGTGTSAREGQTVIIAGSQIQAVGPAASTSIPAGARVLDLANHTLLPGLVQLHEHTYFGGVRRITQMSTSAPLLYLAYGITSAMTAGSQLPYQELNMKRAVDAGVLPGPRFYITGPYLNGGPPRPAMSRNVSSPEEVRNVVAYWASEGATWVKFLGSVTRDVLRAGIEEAHARGLRVTGHLCSITFSEAAALGIDALQHGFITNSDYVPDKQPDACPQQNMRAQSDVDVGSPNVQANIRTLAASKAAVVSTLGVYETFMPGRARLEARALEMLDADTRKEVEATHAGLAAGGLIVPPRLLQKMMQWERDFVAAGGLLGSGSDPWGTGFLPGIGNLRNYELLVEAGFSAEQAIQIMTLNGARIIGEDQRVGSIAAGKLADLIVIRGNPLRSPSDIYNVVTVFKDGIGFDSARLREAARGRVGVN
jgi:imidazolonepropionase-like amidohydrolase